MQKDEIKKYVAELLNEGVSLSEIQKRLQSEKNIKITFLDLRLMVSEIGNIDWSKQQSEKEPEAEKIKPEKEALTDEKSKTIESDNGDAAARTIVEVSRLTRPGTVANGSVKFASGVKADWMIDQYGRLGLNKSTGEPTPEDVKEFQIELQKMLSQ